MILSLEDFKEMNDIEDSDYDAFLTTQLQLISDTVESYCRRKFEEVTVRQTFYRDEHNPSKNITLFHYPVSEVASIEEDGEVLDDEEYRLNGPTGILKRLNYGAFFRSDETVIQYTAGYADGEIPTPVVDVVSSLVLQRLNRKKAGADLDFGSDVQRISIPGVMSIDFDYSLQNNERTSSFGVILGSTVNVLDNYRSSRAIVGSDDLIYVEDV